MRTQLGFSDLLTFSVQFSQTTVRVSDIDLLMGGIVSQVIGVVSIIDGLEKLQRSAIKHLHCAVFGTRNKQTVFIRNKERTLRLSKARDCIRALASLQIDDLDGVIAKRRNKQPLTFDINRHVVDASLNVR